jgi:hypothetical protein
MSRDVFTWYLKEHLLKVRQIFARVSNLPKKPTTRGKIEPLDFQRVGPKSGQLGVTGFECLVVPSRTKKMQVSTSVISSRRMGWLSYWKQVTIARSISVQHPKNVGATIYTKQVATTLGITQQEHHKSQLKICKRKEIRYLPKILMKKINHKWSRSHWHTKNTKTQVKVKTLRGSDLKWFNFCVQTKLHIRWCTKNLTVENSYCNCKKVGITFDARPTICVSFTNKRKTQIGWVTITRQRTWKWTRTNNIPPNRFHGCKCYGIHSFKYSSMYLTFSFILVYS